MASCKHYIFPFRGTHRRGTNHLTLSPDTDKRNRGAWIIYVAPRMCSWMFVPMRIWVLAPCGAVGVSWGALPSEGLFRFTLLPTSSKDDVFDAHVADRPKKLNGETRLPKAWPHIGRSIIHYSLIGKCETLYWTALSTNGHARKHGHGWRCQGDPADLLIARI